MSLPTLARKLRAMIPSLGRLNGVSAIVEDRMPLDAVLDIAGMMGWFIVFTLVTACCDSRSLTASLDRIMGVIDALY